MWGESYPSPYLRAAGWDKAPICTSMWGESYPSPYS